MIICITGIDGSGKSTQIKLLSKYLKSNSYNIFLCKAYGQNERKIFNSFLKTLDKTAFMFLFQVLHIRQRISAQKALAKNQIVLADRWDESYIIYHSNHGILSEKPILRKQLNKIAFNNIKPDITFLLKVSTSVAAQRRKGRKNSKQDYFDKQPQKYHIMMQNGFLELAKKRKWFIIDGNKGIKEIHYNIIKILERRLE